MSRRVDETVDALRAPVRVNAFREKADERIRSREEREMATDALSERLSSKLHLQTKTVGEERIKRAKEKDEDVAIFSMFPVEGDPKFRCCLGKDCLLEDPKKADAGDDRSDRSSRTRVAVNLSPRSARSAL